MSDNSTKFMENYLKQILVIADTLTVALATLLYMGLRVVVVEVVV